MQIEIGSQMDNLRMVRTNDAGCISARNHHLEGVIRKVLGATLPLPSPSDQKIDVQPSFKIPYGRIYNLSELELMTLHSSMQAHQEISFIQR